jgi:hypothetical protein
MKRYTALTVAMLAAGAVGIGMAGTPNAAASSSLAGCAKVPALHYGSPLAALWTSSCEAGKTLGPRSMARIYHFGTTDPSTIAHRYASRVIKIAQKGNASAWARIRRLGVAKATEAIYEGVKAGFRIRGRP